MKPWLRRGKKAGGHREVLDELQGAGQARAHAFDDIDMCTARRRHAPAASRVVIAAVLATSVTLPVTHSALHSAVAKQALDFMQRTAISAI
ncbi:hypothetical protein N0K08_14305 [Acidovorax sp. Be4]|uniref:Uncharacterized protein n=1 Tax=Acidovorax bellezanensis TaxID=2976702 RepID=A0ABT2PMY5_9BURK|nr:hypothetical protein [Acidovorax sp. Be4]MCT9811813.1 hypothetical protein [Acidovorax sp. Be4]